MNMFTYIIISLGYFSPLLLQLKRLAQAFLVGEINHTWVQNPFTVLLRTVAWMCRVSFVLLLFLYLSY